MEQKEKLQLATPAIEEVPQLFHSYSISSHTNMPVRRQIWLDHDHCHQPKDVSAPATLRRSWLVIRRSRSPQLRGGLTLPSGSCRWNRLFAGPKGIARVCCEELC